MRRRYNFQTTRDLIDRLKVVRVLRIICGWRYAHNIPSEAKFSRVYGELARSRIADKTHQAFIKEYLSNTLFFYNSTDSTTIDVREKPLKKEKVPKVKKKRGRKRKDDPTPAAPKELCVRNQQLAMDSTTNMLGSISTRTVIGRKINAKGNGYAWIGGKLRLGVVDGDIPIIDVNTRNREEIKTILEGQKILEKMGFDTPMSNHYNHRSSVERVNSRLKDSFGCKHIFVKGAKMKFMSLSIMINFTPIDFGTDLRGILQIRLYPHKP